MKSTQVLLRIFLLLLANCVAVGLKEGLIQHERSSIREETRNQNFNKEQNKYKNLGIHGHLNKTSAISGRKCDELLKFPWKCYESDFVRACPILCSTKECDTGTCCKLEDRHRDCSSMNPRSCYHGDMLKLCCHSCQKFYNIAKPDCPYGDFRQECSIDDCIHYNSQNLTKCCKTCAPFTMSEAVTTGVNNIKSNTYMCMLLIIVAIALKFF